MSMREATYVGDKCIMQYKYTGGYMRRGQILCQYTGGYICRGQIFCQYRRLHIYVGANIMSIQEATYVGGKYYVNTGGYT